MVKPKKSWSDDKLIEYAKKNRLDPTSYLRGWKTADRVFNPKPLKRRKTKK